MSVSSFSLLVLLYLSYVNLFKELFLNALHWTFLLLLCLRFRSFSKADAKVWLFSVSPKLLSKKVKKICTFRAEIDIPQLKAVSDNSNTLIIYSWELRIGSWEFRGWERKTHNSKFGHLAVRHNICISNAQYYELSARQNLWCEILEFWAVWANAFAHSRLCDFMTKRYEIRLAKEPFLDAIAPLLHSNSATIRM